MLKEYCYTFKRDFSESKCRIIFIISNVQTKFFTPFSSVIVNDGRKGQILFFK